MRRGPGRVEMQVLGVLVPDEQEGPVVILRAVEGEETLVIRIGILEAQVLDMVWEDVEPPRPMTHDLFFETLKAFAMEVVEGEVTDLRDDIYYARLRVRQGDHVVDLDARPSDTMILCLLARAPFYVKTEVFRKAQPQDVAEASRRQWMGFLKSLEAAEDPEGVLAGDEDTQDPAPMTDAEDKKGTVN
ncbi:MAG TPA: bifunctional nuclease family protein [Myxococcota bacterium]|nr:bifunctional nuclease family protein [Myxococcota bacterium]HQK51511.1 bifunctional nuclease family protein [Myxococcota bacterium]